MSDRIAWMNLHNHSSYSDGDFSPEQIAAEAAQGALTHVAITDHFETAKVRRCLTSEQLEGYIKEIRSLNGKYDGSLRVLAGVEIDTNPERCVLEELPIDLLNRLDLVLFEFVNDEWNGGSSFEEIIPLIDRIKSPCGLVHTDFEKVFQGISPQEVADMLASHDLFAEINTGSIYKRQGIPYYEHAERHYRAFHDKVKVGVGTDSHRTLGEVSNVGRGYEFIDRMGLTGDLLKIK
jgi:histidinol phosphatase-like PHP family hydrolase